MNAKLDKIFFSVINKEKYLQKSCVGERLVNCSVSLTDTIKGIIVLTFGTNDE